MNICFKVVNTFLKLFTANGVKVLTNLTCFHMAVTVGYRRRIELEDKAKVVASVWGAECIQFLAYPSSLVTSNPIDIGANGGL